MEDELVEFANVSREESNPLDSLSDEQLAEAVKRKVAEQVTETEPSSSTSEEADEPAEPTKPERVPDVPVVQPIPPSSASTLDLMKKKGFKSTDQMAESYMNLEREFHQSRQPANVKKTEPGNEEETQVYDLEKVRESFLRDLQEDPFGTLARVNEVFNAPLIKRQRKADLELEVTRLSAEHPEFATEEMQDAVTDVFKNHPEWTGNPERYVKDAFFIARGMGKGTKSSVQSTNNDKRKAMVETTSRIEPAEGADPNVMQINSLKKLIQQTINRGG